MQLGAETPQISLTDFAHPVRCPLDTLTQFLVLSQQARKFRNPVLERSALLLDGAACAVDNAEERRHSSPRNRTNNKPAFDLGVEDVFFQLVCALVELRDGNNPV